MPDTEGAKASGFPALPHFELADWIRKYQGRTHYSFGTSGIEPPDLEEAGIDLDVQGFYRRYPTGKVGLEETLAEIFGVDEDGVLVTSSSSEAIYLVHKALLEAGKEVIVPVPNYPAELKVPQVAGAVLKPMRLRFEEGWKLDLDRVEGIVSSKTGMISITNSENPTGMQVSKHNLEVLLQLAGDAHAWLLADEAFREFGFERAAPPAATLGERAISLGTMSKFYGVDDIRIGWILGGKEVVKLAGELKTWTTGGVNSRFAEYVAKQVLENHRWFVERARRYHQDNLEATRRFMKGCRALSWVEPDGCIFGFPKIVDGSPSVEFCRKLVEEHGILLDPGRYFDCEGYLRLCFTQNPERVRAGLEELSRVLSSA